MKKTFKNVMVGVLGMLFMSMMLVTAGVYPIPFVANNVANVAIVYGASAAQTDITAAETLVGNLAGKIVTAEELERIMSAGITEDEVELGSNLDDGIRNVLTDNQIPSLFDGKIDWNDGSDSYRYNVHEEIRIGELRIETSFDNNDFEEVALINDKGLEYRYVFEEIFDGDLGDEDADLLEVTILGEEILIEDINGDSITVTNAENVLLQEGTSTVVDGVTLTVTSVYSEGAFINDVYVKEGKRKTIDGTQVRVETVYYRDSDALPSKVELYAGGEISKEYSDGDAYIGQDEDDPEWVWSISNPGEKDGWIGVKYDLRQVNEDDDVVYEGEQYVFPNNFTTVSFDSLTDVDYYDYDIFFDDIDLYDNIDNDKNDELYNSADVVIIKGTEDDSFELGGDYETDIIYLRKNGTSIEVYYMDLAEDFSTGKAVYYTTLSGVVALTEGEALVAAEAALALAIDAQEAADTANITAAAASDAANTAAVDAANAADAAATAVEIAQAAVASAEGEAALEAAQAALAIAIDTQEAADTANITAAAASDAANTAAVDAANAADAAATAVEIEQGIVDTAQAAAIASISIDDHIATLIADDTEFSIDVSMNNLGGTTLAINGIENEIEISLGNTTSFTQFGVEDEEAESDDVIVNGKSIGTENNDVMDYYGTIIEDPENNADSNKVALKIPSEQVYAQISVLGSEEDTEIPVVVKPTAAELGITKITDGQVATATGKNLIVVGGSCINTLAAELLGGKYCREEFTTKTGVKAGQVLIQTFTRGGNTVTLVAGYHAADTVRGVQHLLTNNLNLEIGAKVII